MSEGTCNKYEPTLLFKRTQIAQILRIGSLTLVICICEILNICGQYKHEHGRNRINGLAICFSPSKKTEKRPLYSQKLIKLKQVPNPFPVKGQGGGWRRKNNRDNAHTAIASCPFTGKDVRRTERGRFQMAKATYAKNFRFFTSPWSVGLRQISCILCSKRKKKRIYQIYLK